MAERAEKERIHPTLAGRTLPPRVRCRHVLDFSSLDVLQSRERGECGCPVVLPYCQAKASEGAAYNVVSNVPVDEAKLRKLEEAQANTTLTRVRHAVEAFTTTTALAAEAKGK